MNMRLLTIKQAAVVLGKSESWLRAKISRGQGPRVFQVSPRSMEIREEDLRAWLESNTAARPGRK